MPTDTDTLGRIIRSALRAAGIRRKLPDEVARWREYEAGKSIVRARTRTDAEYRGGLGILAEWVGV